VQAQATRGQVAWDEVRRRALTVLAFWTAYLGFVTTQQYVVVEAFGASHSWFEDAVQVLHIFWTWIPLSAVLLFAVVRLPLLERPLRNALLLVAIIAVVAHVRVGLFTLLEGTALHVVSFEAPSWAVYRRNLSTSGHRELLSGLFYTAFFAVHHAYRIAQERTRASTELQARLAQAELRYLRVQLQPHFLFNALNAVTTLIRKDAQAAEVTLGHLGDLLRRVLDNSEAQLVTLAREIEFLQHYIAIQHVRFGDRLRTAVDVAPDTRDVLIPSMVLQPLVENAIRHSIARREGGAIAVSARRTRGDLIVEVVDDGEGIHDAHAEAAGTGIANVRARLEHLFGPRATIRIRNVPNAFTVEICLPAVTA